MNVELRGKIRDENKDWHLWAIQGGKKNGDGSSQELWRGGREGKCNDTAGEAKAKKGREYVTRLIGTV